MRPPLVRALSTRASAIYTNPANPHDLALTSTPLGLTRQQRTVLDNALRVDHAGEIAANYIYKGQMAVLGRDSMVGPLIQVCIARRLWRSSWVTLFCTGNVGSGKTTPPCHGQTSSTTSGATYNTL